MNAHRPTTQPDLQAAIDEYRAQIVRCARSLAVAKNDAVAADLAGGMPLERVKMFTDGNLDKRFLKLKDQLELFEDEFEDLEELIVEYVKSVPLAAYDTGSSDSGHFMEWLCGTRELTPEQLDCVACQQSRIEVEEIAETNRLPHVRFQDLLSRADDLAPELGLNDNLWIHLNPIRVWATFYTNALVDEEDEVPARVLFFPVGNDIRTAILEPSAVALLRDLEALAPCRLDDVAAAASEFDQSEAVELCRDLAELGLVAFG